MKNCEPDTCSPSEISEAYYNLSEYELSCYFQRLHLEHSNLSLLQQTEALLRLHSCSLKVGNYNETISTADEIVKLSALLMDEESLEIYNNMALYRNVTRSASLA